MKYDLFQVSGKDGRGREFCAGVIFRDGRFWRSAPIVKSQAERGVWAIRFKKYCAFRGWKLVHVESW